MYVDPNKTFQDKWENIKDNWIIIDAKNLESKIIGRLSTKIAHLLKGKDSISYSPHVAGNKKIIVINCDHLEFSGDKWNKKIYYHHTGYVGHLKEVLAKDMKTRRGSTYILRQSILRMLKKTPLRKEIMTNLYLEEGEDHKHHGQKPVKFII